MNNNDLFPGDEEWNRLSRINSLVPTTFQNMKGKTVHLKMPVEFGNADHIAYLRNRELQLKGEKRIELFHPSNPNKNPCFFKCINPAKYNPDEFYHPACIETHFADWNHVATADSCTSTNKGEFTAYSSDHPNAKNTKMTTLPIGKMFLKNRQLIF
jgi:hypothetical protein